MDRQLGMPHHAALYVRQSQTAEGSASMDIQLESCRQTAARFDIPVAHELCERPSTSGYKNRGRDRPQFLRLLELIRAGEVDCVVVYKSDRLSRGGGVGYAPLLEAIEEAGHEANRFILHADGWLSEFELGIRAAIDREESTKISSRMLDVRAREARDGKPRPCRGYGYKYSKVTKRMNIVDSEAETIRECVARVLAGETPYGIVQDLNRRRVRTVTGRPWKTSVLIGVLRASRIAGLRSHNGVIVAKGQWDPITSEDEYHRVLALTGNRYSHGPKRGARTYPLIGFVTCGKCGQPLRSHTSAGKVRTRRRYVCRSGELGGCGGIQIKAEFLEDAVRDYVIGTLANPELREQLLAAVPAADDSTQAVALRDLHRIALARERLTDLAVDGTIALSEVRRKNLELDDQATTAEQRLADLPGIRELPHLPLSVNELMTEWTDRGITFNRHLIGLLIENVTVNPARPAGPGFFDEGRLAWSLR